MLSSIRNAFKGTLGRILVPFVIALVVLAFAFVGVPDLRNFTQRSALEVGKTKFTAAELRDEMTRQIELYRQQTGQSLTMDEAVGAGLLEETITTLAARSSMRQETDELGLIATNDMIGEYLRAEPAFANRNTGRFDQQMLGAILQNNNLTLEQFRDRIEFELLTNQVLESLGTNIPAPEVWVDYQLKRQGEIREVTYVSLSTPAEAVEAPTEEELRGYYEAHADDYMAPEYRTFRAMVLTNADFAEGMERSEEDVRALFEARRAYLGTPETRTVRQLTYQSETAADAAYTRLTTGTPFEQLAEEQGFPLERVTFENITRSGLTDPAIAEAFFSAEGEGTVVGPVNGLLGYAVGEVLEITPGIEPTFEEEREALEAELNEDETSRLLFDAIERVELARDEGAPLETAVDESPQAELITYGPVDRDLFTPDDAVMQDLPVEILNEAFSLEPGEESPVLDLEDRSGYFAVVVDDVTDPQLRPFEDVRGEVLSAYLKERRRAASEQKLAELRSAVEGGTSLAEAAQALGLDTVTTQLSARAAQQDLPVSFTTEVFRTGTGTLVSGWADDGTSVYAGIVRRAIFDMPPQRDQIMDVYKTSVGPQIAGELAQAYLTELQNDLEVRRDPAQLNRLFNYGPQ